MAIMSLSRDKNNLPIQIGKINNGSVIDGSSVSTQSSIFDEKSDTDLHLKALSDMWIMIGTNPTAVAESGLFLNEGESIDIRISANERIACLGGKLNIVVFK